MQTASSHEESRARAYKRSGRRAPEWRASMGTCARRRGTCARALGERPSLRAQAGTIFAHAESCAPELDALTTSAIPKKVRTRSPKWNTILNNLMTTAFTVERFRQLKIEQKLDNFDFKDKSMFSVNFFNQASLNLHISILVMFLNFHCIPIFQINREVLQIAQYSKCLMP